MRRALLALSFLLACIIQALALAGQQRTVMMQPPGWVLQGQPVSMDWARGRYWAPGMGYTGPLVLTTTTRASTKYCQMLSGIWQTTNNNNYPAICDQGVLSEEARTNNVLWSRDMTQAGSWTLVGATAALNAAGIDGRANSASTLTATGTAGVCTTSCTALQTFVLGSQTETYSVWLKRITGSGAVNITINNLTGTTACTLVTTAFTRCQVSATLINPTIGVQMTAVGDVIVADFNQMEPSGTFPTSPILTTTATVTRAADNIAVTGLFNALTASLAQTQYSKVGPIEAVNNNNRIGIFYVVDRGLSYASSATAVTIYNGVTTQAATVGSSQSFLTSSISTVGSFDGSGMSIVSNMGAEATNIATFSSYSGPVLYYTASGNTAYLNGYAAHLAFFTRRLSAGHRINLSGM